MASLTLAFKQGATWKCIFWICTLANLHNNKSLVTLPMQIKNPKKMVSACKSFVYPIRFGNEMEKIEKQTCIKCSPEWRKWHIGLSSVQMSEGCSQGSWNWPLNTGLTGLKVTQEKMMVGKSVHFKTNPPHPSKSVFYLSLCLRKRTYRPFNSIHINKKQEEIKISWWEQVKDDQTANGSSMLW